MEKQLTEYRKDSIPFENLRKEIAINHPKIKRVAYAKTVEMSDAGLDTIPTFLVRWDEKSAKTKDSETDQLQRWLKQRLSLDTLRIVEF